MKVSELIEKLRTLPMEAEVYAIDGVPHVPDEKFVGGYKHESRWKGSGTRWVRGKLHGYEMLLDLSQWSNRQTFFLKRFYDLPTQLFLKRALKVADRRSER